MAFTRWRRFLPDIWSLPFPAPSLRWLPAKANFVSRIKFCAARVLCTSRSPRRPHFLGRIFRQCAARRSSHLCLDRSWRDLERRLHISPGAIRHVHNIVYDQWQNCLWVLTGDNGPECRILRASCDFSAVDTVLSGNQQARAVALVPTSEGLYFSSDTPFETNHVYFLDRQGKLSERAVLSSSSIYGCSVGDAIFFSTMVEPSAVNLGRSVKVYGSDDGQGWRDLVRWEKDWPDGNISVRKRSTAGWAEYQRHAGDKHRRGRAC